MSLFRRLFARQPLAWTSSESEGPGLRRALGWPALTCIGLGTMLGGIFPTIGAGAHHAGPGVILSFVLSGIVCVAVALCYAEFASMVPVAGSAYTYAYATLGEIVAWVIGWDLVLEYGISAAPVASSWSSYAQSFLSTYAIVLPAWASTAHLNGAHSQIDLLAALIVLVISSLLALGIRESSRVNVTFVALQLAAMAVFLIAVGPHVRAVNLHPFAPYGYHGIIGATALVFFAYIGFDTVTVAAEEAHDPHRNVPIGIMLSLVIGGILYVALTYVTVGALQFTKLSDGGAMSDAIRAVTSSKWLRDIVDFGGIAGNTTVMLTSLLGQVRIFYVMARDRMLPPGVAQIHHVFRTPARMTMITGVVVSVLAAIVPLDKLLALVNIGTLSAFAIVSAGVVVLRFMNPGARRPFRVPFGPVVGAFGFLASIYLIVAGLSLETWIRFVIWFLAGLALYGAYGFWHSRLRTGEAPPLPPVSP
ncbi:MAG: amino acid permease [Candidatus Eremiobacteraeota bacterium]|nr:amino acid permease [Candidatus Eremiobacteraeota bacterium]